MQTKIASRVLSVILSVSLLMFQMGMSVVYAVESNPMQESKTITAFVDLAEDVKNITVLGTAEAPLMLLASSGITLPTVDGNVIYANGTPLLIVADGTGTTVYIDSNANGVLDSGEKSLADAGISNAPQNGASLLYTSIYGGGHETNAAYNTHIVMTGGYISNLYGGCCGTSQTANLTGDTYIKVTGGTINGYCRGGTSGSGSTISGSTTVIMTGGTAIFDISGTSDWGTVTEIKTGIVTSTKAYESGFDNGFLKIDTNTYIAKGTITLPSDFDFTLPAGATLTVQQGANITNEGKLTIQGNMVNDGAFTNNGIVKSEGGSYSGSGNSSWSGTPIENLKVTVSSAKEITDSSAQFTVNCNRDATVYYLASETPITDTSTLETTGTSKSVSANTDTDIEFTSLNNNTPYTYYVAAKAGNTFTDIKTVAFTTLKKSPNLQLEGTVSGKVFDDTPISHSTVNGDLFTWDSGGALSFTYFTDSNGTKTTNASSGAANEGASPKNAGTYYLKATLAENDEYAGAETDYIPFTITKSATEFTGGIKTYKGEEATDTFTYGDTITVQVTPKATGTAPAAKSLQAMLSFSAPEANQMALFVGDKQITETVNATDGIYTMTYDTKAKDLVIGSNTITAKYVGSNNMADYSESTTVTLNKKAITSAVVNSDTSASKEYDGTNSFTSIALTTLEGVENDDNVQATADGTVTDVNVGTGKTFTAISVKLDGEDKDYYSLDNSAVSGNVSITQATATGVSQELQAVKGLEKEYTFDLTKLLPALSDGKSFGDITYTVGTVTDDYKVLAQNPTTDTDIVDGKITLKVANVVDKDKKAAIQIKVTSENYKDFTADLIVKTTDKLPLTIEAVFTGRTYNGKPYAYTGTPTFKNDEETVSGITYTAKYTGRDGTTYDESETAPTNVGKYNLILTVSGESANTYVATTTIGFEITEKLPYVPPYNPPTPTPQPTTETREVPVVVDNGGTNTNAAQVPVTRTTDSDGIKTDTVKFDEDKAKETVTKALETKTDTATISVTDIPGNNADKVEVQVPQSSMTQLGSNNIGLDVRTEKAALELPKETVSGLKDKDAKIQISEVKDSNKVEETKGLILKLASGSEVIAAPLKIETNFTGKTKITLPIDASKLPISKEELDKFLSSLAVMVQHSDGENAIDKGTITYDEKGKAIGISIWVDKFSDFTLISLPESYFQGRTTVMKDKVVEDKEWQIKFTKTADSSTITKDNVYVTDLKGNRVEVEVSYGSDNILKVTPLNPYKSGETYYLYISKNVKSRDKTALVNELRYQFTIK
ncbi:Ig-like domain-containing protein [Clostridium sp. PL3]|uniref:Ig-like domain-containing protein n=1 Tax=Clostridium thailandense TaxID=2794346 RepID=A0A949X1T8_9CLOT|nr:YDG domain-containing protein [Clostridium thailandense]MBV7272479.1 Ig-like domain-containing protein [Clostridium thailandense]